MESTNNNTNKNKKSKLIENMLDEVGMSKQQLIELLTNVIELEESQSVEVDEGKVFIRGSEILSEEDKKDISEVLSQDELKALANRVALANSVVLAKKIGVEVDDEIAAIMGLENTKKLSFQSFVSSLKNLSKDQVNKLKNIVDNKIAEKQKDKQGAGLLDRFMGAVRGAAGKASDKLKNTMHVLDYKEDIARLKQTAKEIESANSTLKNFESKIRSQFSQVGKIKYKNGEVLAQIEGLTSLVNLKEFIKSVGELTPELSKMIDDAGSTASNMQKNLIALNKEIGADIDGMGFDKNGKLNVEKQVEGNKKKIHIDDYLGDMDRLSLEKARLKDKAADDLNLKRALDIEELEFENQVGEIEESAEKRDISIKKETKTTKDDLVKLDIMADKSKLLEAQNLMRDGMKGMQEAQKNKDLLDNIKKDLLKNREMEK